MTGPRLAFLVLIAAPDDVRIVPRVGYFEVFYDSEVGDAAWADSAPPYDVPWSWRPR